MSDEYQIEIPGPSWRRLWTSGNANGVNAYQYQRSLLIALPSAKTADDYDALLPWNIALSNI